MDTAELIKKVRKVEIKTRRLSRNLFTGGYHSAFKGRGMSFSEVRQYQFGDDIRAIDWNVTARTGEPHVKIFEEERELTVMLMVDVSGSSFFGTTGQFKQELLTEICALLAFSADSNNDKVGLLLFSDKNELYIAPKKGRQHTLRIIRELLNVQPSDRGTDIAAAFQYTRNVLKKRSVCFVLSDFWAHDYDAALRVLARRHDCIGIHCWDPRERKLPDVGLLRVRDAESGQQVWIDTTDPTLRAHYTERFDENRDYAAGAFRRAGADFLSLQMTDSYASALLRFFEQRARVGAH
ncbi:MAG: DUF58 domain-containing protein [Haliscomenobacteraceae bacterium CHB4]|nr:hypothetical protein [Saprospiraceae bacterium]MCE7926103.1 DUF58 domain-containing protein [Haliscomenobacteraceae bacterium CHB4]